MARKRIDARTRTMSTVTLACRSLGHGMVEKKVPRARELELKQLGQYEVQMVCFRGCGRWRNVICDAATDEVVGQSGNYTDKSYLVAEHGTGRLGRAASRGAYRQRRDRD